MHVIFVAINLVLFPFLLILMLHNVHESSFLNDISQDRYNNDSP